MFNSQLRQVLSPIFFRRYGAKALAFVFWLTFLGGYYWYTRQNDLTVTDSIHRMSDLLANSLYGPLLYMLFYALRPLIFFPATILTLLGGFLFGPFSGVIYTILGSNASAMVAYSVGCYFGQGILEDEAKAGLIQTYKQRLRENSFETVLIMRLLFLPYDLVNYAAGFLKIRWSSFLAATAIGSVPGTISFILFGASFGTLKELLAGNVQLNPSTVITSIVIVGISIGLSRIIKKREARMAKSHMQEEPV